MYRTKSITLNWFQIRIDMSWLDCHYCLLIGFDSLTGKCIKINGHQLILFCVIIRWIFGHPWNVWIDQLLWLQEHLNSILNDEYEFQNVTSWLPKNIYDFKGKKVQIKFLIGADILEQLSGVSLSADKQLATSWSKEEVSF